MNYPKLFSPKSLLMWLMAALFAVSLGALPAQAQPFAYVPNIGSNDVSVINVANNTVVATVPVGDGPTVVAITPDGAFVYVTQRNLSTFAPEVAVIATASNTVVAVVPLVGCGFAPIPIYIAITPDGAFAYVANTSSNDVSVIATASNTVVATVPVGPNPQGGVAITPDGAFVYVPNRNSDDVSVIATAGNTVVATVPGGDGPNGVAITPDGAFAYVTNNGSNDVSVIATASNTVVATVPVGFGPGQVAITPALSVEDLIADLIAQIQAMNISGGVGNALMSKLENALANFQAGDTQGALGLLNAFIQQVEAQRGKKLTNAEADQLVAGAQALIDAINASAAPAAFAAAKTALPQATAPMAPAANPPSEIRFTRSEARQGGMTMKAFNASGQEVRRMTLAPEQLAAFRRFANLNPTGKAMPAGLPQLKPMQDLFTALESVNAGEEVIVTLPGKGKDFSITKSAAKTAAAASLPTGFALEQNYPNPFNPETEIRFALPEAGQVTVKIFSTTGQEIRTLANAAFQAGYQTLRWDGRDQSGNAVAAGVYLYKLIVTGENGAVKFNETKRMAFVK